MSWVHLFGNVLCAVDIETTGRVPGYHEIIQIGIQVLTTDCEPDPNVTPFYHTIRPEHPDRSEVDAGCIHNLDLDHLVAYAPDKWEVADWLEDWFQKIPKPMGKKLAPIAQNWQFEASFIREWIGIEAFNAIINCSHARDTMIVAGYVRDYLYKRGQTIPFKGVGLRQLCHDFGIVNENPHDALADARAEAAVYKKLLEYNLV